jgi:hypothetical protein
MPFSGCNFAAQERGYFELFAFGLHLTAWHLKQKFSARMSSSRVAIRPDAVRHSSVAEDLSHRPSAFLTELSAAFSSDSKPMMMIRRFSSM